MVPIEPHSGHVDLQQTFSQAHSKLGTKESTRLSTGDGKLFDARGATARDGRLVVKFFQHGKEYARAYDCCWGHYYNCYRTRIGMYCRALDTALSA